MNYSLEDDKILFNMLYQHVGLAEMEKHSGVVLYRHVAKLVSSSESGSCVLMPRFF